MVKSVRGMYDVLPYNIAKDFWQSSCNWMHVHKVIWKIADRYGLSYIKTPIIEFKELYVKSAGSTADVVNKEMYEFTDRSERSLVLRPEGTAGVSRALSEGGMQPGQIIQGFYVAPMFRYDRPQSGRYREHWQFGVEIVGDDSVLADVKTIEVCRDFFEEMGVSFSVNINYMCFDRIDEYKESLIDFLSENESNLSDYSRERYRKNPLRVLDSKSKEDIKICENAPQCLNFLSSEEIEKFEMIKRLLGKCNIDYRINHSIIRGLDYYSGFIFEVLDSSNRAIAGGGRYNNLVQINKKHIPSVGFGTGIERTLINSKIDIVRPTKIAIFYKDLKEKALDVIHKLSNRIIRSSMQVVTIRVSNNFSKALENAKKTNINFYAFVGEREMDSGEVNFIDVSSKSVHKVFLNENSCINI